MQVQYLKSQNKLPKMLWQWLKSQNTASNFGTLSQNPRQCPIWWAFILNPTRVPQMPEHLPTSNAGKFSRPCIKGQNSASNSGRVALIQDQYPSFSGSISNQASIAPFQILFSSLFIGQSIILCCRVCFINLIKPTGHVMHQQFNIQQLYVLPTLYLCVLYWSENRQRLVPLTA